ncbi:metalloregulator ArsR/SmtB family transcription factor [Providencia vermicola]|uniref:metalloregulator ArsR/SmtB family transcription factor n=1 Tax=Providencia vermicola TaxID=333965 RepID=UPI003FA08403
MVMYNSLVKSADVMSCTGQEYARLTHYYFLGSLVRCDICGATTEPQPKISLHIALLRESGLVIDRREGKWIHYRLLPHMPSWAADIIDTAWNYERENICDVLSSAIKTSC